MSPDEFGTPELFDLAPAAAGSFTGEAVTKASAPKAVTSATCPKCRAERDVGLLRSGTHLVWRDHTYRTWSGAAQTCQASGVAVCVLPPRGQRSTSAARVEAKCKHN